MFIGACKLQIFLQIYCKFLENYCHCNTKNIFCEYVWGGRVPKQWQFTLYYCEIVHLVLLAFSAIYQHSWKEGAWRTRISIYHNWNISFTKHIMKFFFIASNRWAVHPLFRPDPPANIFMPKNMFSRFYIFKNELASFYWSHFRQLKWWLLDPLVDEWKYD